MISLYHTLVIICNFSYFLQLTGAIETEKIETGTEIEIEIVLGTVDPTGI